MLRGRPGVFLAIIIAPTVLAACGGGGEPLATTTALSKTQFTVKANLLCKESEKRRKKRFEVANEWVTRDNLSRTLKEKIALYVVVVPVEDLARELKELGDVQGHPAIASYPDRLEQDAQAGRAKPLAVFSGVAFKDSDLLASKHGLSSCTL